MYKRQSRKFALGDRARSLRSLARLLAGRWHVLHTRRRWHRHHHRTGRNAETRNHHQNPMWPSLLTALSALLLLSDSPWHIFLLSTVLLSAAPAHATAVSASAHREQQYEASRSPVPLGTAHQRGSPNR
eukprot:3622231-Prymnesium_polylepis.2